MYHVLQFPNIYNRRTSTTEQSMLQKFRKAFWSLLKHRKIYFTKNSLKDISPSSSNSGIETGTEMLLVVAGKMFYEIRSWPRTVLFPACFSTWKHCNEPENAKGLKQNYPLVSAKLRNMQSPILNMWWTISGEHYFQIMVDINYRSGTKLSINCWDPIISLRLWLEH